MSGCAHVGARWTHLGVTTSKIGREVGAHRRTYARTAAPLSSSRTRRDSARGWAHKSNPFRKPPTPTRTGRRQRRPRSQSKATQKTRGALLSARATPHPPKNVEPWWKPGGTLVEAWWNPGATLVLKAAPDFPGAYLGKKMTGSDRCSSSDTPGRPMLPLRAAKFNAHTSQSGDARQPSPPSQTLPKSRRRHALLPLPRRPQPAPRSPASTVELLALHAALGRRRSAAGSPRARFSDFRLPEPLPNKMRASSMTPAGSVNTRSRHAANTL